MTSHSRWLRMLRGSPWRACSDVALLISTSCTVLLVEARSTKRLPRCTAWMAEISSESADFFSTYPELPAESAERRAPSNIFFGSV